MNTFLKKITTHKQDIFIVIILLLLASIPRLFFLDTYPSGIHGDEGWTGIDAKQILVNGSIPPYVNSAIGQPTGPLYITAIIFKIFDPSIFTLRLSMSIFGILTVGVLYIFLRYHFSTVVSFLTTLSFCFALMHIHFSHIAFMLISAPFFALLSLIIFIIGRKQKKLLYIIISAFIMGIGMYSYNTFIIFPIPLFILLCVDLLYYRKAYQLKALLVYICVFVVSASPLLYIMLSDPDFYFSHHRAYSILSTPDFLNERLWNKSILVLLNGIQNLKSFFIGYHLDHIDSFGEFYNYNIIYLILICIGFLVALIQRKFYPLFILFYVLFLLSSSFFVFEGVYRRQIIAYTLLFYFIALAIQFMYSKVKNTHRNFVSLSLLAVITIVSLHNLYTYFISYAHSEHQKTVFAYEFTQAALKIDTSFKEYPIILYSSRFSCSHESFRFFELDSRCANSSHEFGLLPVQENTHASVHVFLDSYIPEHNQVSKELIITDKYEILDKHTHQVKGVILKSL